MSMYYQKLHDNIMPDRVTSSTAASSSDYSSSQTPGASSSTYTMSESTSQIDSTLHHSDSNREMHEFIPKISSIENVPIINPYQPPPPKQLPESYLINNIGMLTYGALSRVRNVVPNLLYMPNLLFKPPTYAPSSTPVPRSESSDPNAGIPIPPPPLPQIPCTQPLVRASELTAEEFHSSNFTKKELFQIIFKRVSFGHLIYKSKNEIGLGNCWR